MEAIAIRLEAIATRLEAIAIRLGTIPIRLQAVAIASRPSLVRGMLQNKRDVYNRFFNEVNEVWLLIGLSPFIWFPLHQPPHAAFLVSFMSFLSSCPVILTLFFLARTLVPVGALVCAHTRARAFLNKLIIGAPGLLQ